MSGGGGSGGMFGGITGRLTGQGQGQGGTPGRNPSAPVYGAQTTSPSPNHYTPSYTQPVSQPAPQQNIQNMGLEALYQGMMQNFTPTYNRASTQQQMPSYQNPALNYRPDMSGITANLKRVAPSVQEQQRLAAEEAARKEAEEKANGFFGWRGMSE